LLLLIVAMLRAPGAWAGVIVSVAYYDTEHASPTKPDPWQGSAGVTFFGGPDAATGIWDTGGIMFFNQGPAGVIVAPGLKVDGFANGASFQSWDGDIGAGGFLLGAGHGVIFAGHGSGTFDTSDQPIINDPNLRTNNHPLVHVTIGNVAYTFTDAAQVLNTGGFDPGEAFHVSESIPWTQVGATPEPASALLLAGGALAAVTYRRRRRRADMGRRCRDGRAHGASDRSPAKPMFV
jgi:hypothetical protein